MSENDDVLSAVLDQLDTAAEAETVSVGTVVEASGTRSFATLMLVFALIAVSPASIVPGVTTVVALLEFLLVTQMIAGRRHLWLPVIISERAITGERLRSAVSWLRKPIAVIDHILQPRLSFLTEKPYLYLWLFLILGLTLVMPFMELVRGTGTVASCFIALVAAAVLTRDGALLLLAGLCLAALVWVAQWLGGALL
ncbi:exopolysaccharide biosynthesis protein [Rhodobacter sp. 24-YEA-8]|uniref:exopolysaccharide biosynthesis protein n=1 Tax=Rhodobacter sp. 24-YEA-8 TaxID=1884310 RepID=UPI00089C5A8F|nr:exopolysaccharide biosynthesis protein [Rhodobacter sp. 24-YEA-8]SED50222.1 Uncharacterized conserved protein [Rhodobacter sp. 24-YEA-8]